MKPLREIASKTLRGVGWKWHWIFYKVMGYKEKISVLQCVNCWKKKGENIATSFSKAPQIAVKRFY